MAYLLGFYSLAIIGVVSGLIYDFDKTAIKAKIPYTR